MKLAALIVAISSISYAKDIPPPVTDLASLEALKAVVADAKDAPVVLHFWATWCGPCVKEIPSLAKWLPAAEKRGAMAIVVSVDAADDRLELVTKFLKKRGFRTPSYLAQVEAEAVSAWLDPTWDGDLPVTFVLRGGKVSKVFRGPVPSEAALTQALAAIPATTGVALPRP